MRIGVCSDVHGRHDRLLAVLAAMAASGVDERWCLGDLATVWFVKRVFGRVEIWVRRGAARGEVVAGLRPTIAALPAASR